MIMNTYFLIDFSNDFPGENIRQEENNWSA